MLSCTISCLAWARLCSRRVRCKGRSDEACKGEVEGQGTGKRQAGAGRGRTSELSWRLCSRRSFWVGTPAGTSQLALLLRVCMCVCKGVEGEKGCEQRVVEAAPPFPQAHQASMSELATDSRSLVLMLVWRILLTRLRGKEGGRKRLEVLHGQSKESDTHVKTRYTSKRRCAGNDATHTRNSTQRWCAGKDATHRPKRGAQQNGDV